MTRLDYLQIDSEGFILFAGINQSLLKVHFIPILLTFMSLVALLSENGVVKNLKSSQTRTQPISTLNS